MFLKTFVFYKVSLIHASQNNSFDKVSWNSASPEALFLFITNQDYEIDDQSYPFRKQRDVRVSVELPSWITAKDVYSITPNGIKDLPFKVTKGKAIIRPGDIDVCQLVAVVPEGTSKQRHQQEYENARADETRKFWLKRKSTAASNAGCEPQKQPDCWADKNYIYYTKS